MASYSMTITAKIEGADIEVDGQHFSAMLTCSLKDGAAMPDTAHLEIDGQPEPLPSLRRAVIRALAGAYTRELERLKTAA